MTFVILAFTIKGCTIKGSYVRLREEHKSLGCDFPVVCGIKAKVLVFIA